MGPDTGAVLVMWGNGGHEIERRDREKIASNFRLYFTIASLTPHLLLASYEN